MPHARPSSFLQDCHSRPPPVSRAAAGGRKASYLPLMPHTRLLLTHSCRRKLSRAQKSSEVRPFQLATLHFWRAGLLAAEKLKATGSAADTSVFVSVCSSANSEQEGKGERWRQACSTCRECDHSFPVDHQLQVAIIQHDPARFVIMLACLSSRDPR